MIQRINLRGISRSPSDRMTEDGGCAESLNFQIQDGESAPAVPAKALTGVIDPTFLGSIIFIHKNKGNYTNYIGYQSGKLYWVKPTTKVEIASNVASDVKVFSVGNVLVALHGGDKNHFLFKENAYRKLAGSIPFPEVEVFCDPAVKTFSNSIVYSDNDSIVQGIPNPLGGPSMFPSGDKLKYADYFNFENRVWNTTQKELSPSDTSLNIMLEEVKRVKEFINTSINTARKEHGIYTRPMLMKYSLVLYDGTEIDSPPVLIMPVDGSNCEYVSIHNFNTQPFQTVKASSQFILSYTLGGAKLMLCTEHAFDSIVDEWSDIVIGFRIYLSEDIHFKEHNNVTKVKNTRTSYTDNETETFYTETVNSLKLTSDEFDREKFEGTGNFFCVVEKTIKASNSQNIQLDYFSNDDRAVRQELKVSAINPLSSYTQNGMTVYNNKVFAYDVKEKFYKGIKNTSGQVAMEPSSTIREFSVRYILQDSLGDLYATERRDMIALPEYLPILIYPDIRCIKAIVRYQNIDFEVDMVSHPSMNAAYFYNFSLTDSWGITGLLTYVISGTTVPGVTKLNELYDFSSLPSEGNNTYRMYTTPVNNFYYFTKSYILDAPIVGVTKNTAALSSGQYGQYPVTVFTKDGIWGVAVDTAGELAGGFVPLQREIARDGCIWQIDNATIFLTDKSVYMMSGAQMMDIAPDMDGKHYSVEDDVETQVQLAGFYELLIGVEDPGVTFMDFMEEASMSYDYNSHRLIFFRCDKAYAYAYMIDTKSWHKLSLPEGYEFMNTLNSYPESQVVLREKQYAVIRRISYSGTVDLTNNTQINALLTSISEWMETDSGYNSGNVATDAEWIACMRGQADLVTNQPYNDNDMVSGAEDALKHFGFTIKRLCTYKSVKVYNFSSGLTSGDYLGTTDKEQSVIITRPFDLGAPDVLKTINHIRIRGQYEPFEYVTKTVKKLKVTVSHSTYTLQDLIQAVRDMAYQEVKLTDDQLSILYDGGAISKENITFDIVITPGMNVEAYKDQCLGLFKNDLEVELNGCTVTITTETVTEKNRNKPNVSYILLGSQDGKNFYNIGKLRGKSWKLFRMIILANLRMTDRISWVDVDFETRFNNKLR